MRYPVDYLAPHERCNCTRVPGVHGIGHPHITADVETEDAHADEQPDELDSGDNPD